VFSSLFVFFVRFVVSLRDTLQGLVDTPTSPLRNTIAEFRTRHDRRCRRVRRGCIV